MKYVAHELEPGAKVNLVYMFFSPPATFTFQYFDSFDELLALMDEIQDYVTTDPPLPPAESIVIGHPVLAKYSEDDLWYRAEVISSAITDEKVEVMFVDYGNSELVSLSNILNVPPSKTAVLWKQALTCQLSNGKCIISDWSDELVKVFEELTKGSDYMTATVLQTNDSHVIVSFVDTCPAWANFFQNNAVL